MDPSASDKPAKSPAEGKPPQQEAARKDTPGATPAPPAISLSDKIKYLIDTDRQVHVNIQFADKKANIYLVISGAILAYLLDKTPFATTLREMVSQPGCFSPLLGPCSLFVAYASTMAAIFMFSWVIWPRGFRPAAPAGYFDADRIAKYHDAGEYTVAYQHATPEDFTTQMCDVLLQRAKTNHRKYRWLRAGIACTYASWLSTACLLLVRN